MSAPMTPEQRAKVAELIGDAKPATDQLLLEMAQQILDRREHDHSTAVDWDWYCLNAAGWLGDKAPTVLRRLLDAEAEVDRLRARVDWYHGELTGANLTAWETEQENGLLRTALESAGREPQWAARVRLAYESARRGRRDVQLRCELAEAKRDALQARLAELDALKLGAVDGRMSATCRDPQHPTWLRAAEDTRECPWCRVAELERTAVLAEEDYRRVVRGACQIESQLRARVAELEALTPAPVQTCRTCGAGYTLGQPCSVCEFKKHVTAAAAPAEKDTPVGESTPPEALSPWERAVAGLNALVDADVIFHVEPDGHISAPFSDEHIEWDLKARRWVLTHDDEHDGGSDV
ncbi:hypothetical protein ABT282_15770 [Streptomyces sp. NPDC000927]|uniref:hypothetical protein n=1 Tax=Streptomyces sp. NPDC000927 TaxID=3154371 RepID=UPI0033334DCC